ncbi:MAG: energy transducer TonB [Candidatus Omnitrophota bacterium]
MLTKRPFLTAIVLSLLVHLVILLRMPGFYSILRQPDTVQVEVKYVESKKQENLQPTHSQPKASLRPKREPLLKLPSFISASASAPSPFTDKQELQPGKKKDLGRGGRVLIKPALIRPDTIGSVKKKITLAAPRENLDLNKINSPSYIGYFQLTREKVKRILYQRYTYMEEGEVYLSFIVSNSGDIKDVRVDDDRSSASPYLREIAMASVRESSPFPAFPKDLEYPELTFNVVVSFEVE